MYLLFFTVQVLPSGSHKTGKLTFWPEEKTGRTSKRNLILSSFPEKLRQEFPARLIKLQEEFRLAKCQEPYENIYFPLSGIVALRANGIDVAVVGYEGIIGSSVACGNTVSSFDTVVALPGVAFEVPIQAFLELSKMDSQLQVAALKFERTLMLHIAGRFFGERLTTQEARLAHHLAMCFDRIKGPELIVTHSTLGEALGVRRAGVTDALHGLEGRGMISATRGRIIVKDLDQLRRASEIAYGPAEREYERLFGFSFARSG